MCHAAATAKITEVEDSYECDEWEYLLLNTWTRIKIDCNQQKKVNVKFDSIMLRSLTGLCINIRFEFNANINWMRNDQDPMRQK